jgi:hypothetical protein
MQVGIVPASIFILKFICCNDDALQIVAGIVPMITLLLTSNLFNSGNDPYDEGREPETIVLL